MSNYSAAVSGGGKCRGGCGKTVITRSGLCVPCRTKSCKLCGKTFHWKHEEKAHCAECDHARKKFAKNNTNSIYGSI
jgi:hypothetical protein